MSESVWKTVEIEMHGGNDHQIEIRRRVLKNGAVQYWEQCVICGRAPRAVSANDHRLLNQTTIKPFDTTLHGKFNATFYEEASRRSQAERQSAGERINRDWWDAYRRYLKTPQWMARSRHVLERDNYLCQACLRQPATQAHHLTYKHVFEEPLFDLIAVCSACHERISALDRKRRGDL